MYATVTCLVHLAEKKRLRSPAAGRIWLCADIRPPPAACSDAAFERFITLGFVQPEPDGLFRITPAGRAQVRYAPR